jgi:hypothetical protein
VQEEKNKGFAGGTNFFNFFFKKKICNLLNVHVSPLKIVN